ncbi:MAG: aldo/keto reductase [Candidatus Sumerlaeia bacterium]
MRYVRLGKTNLMVSPFCLGTMMFGGKTAPQKKFWGKADKPEAVKMIHTAIDGGVNFIDTADIYTGGQSEEIVGEALRDGKRDGIVLATKAGMKTADDINGEGISRFHIMRALENSLKRMGTDYVDLFYIHWPTKGMNLEEMMRTLDDLERQGKIRYAACSNFPAWLACKCQWIADSHDQIGFVAGQYPYNIIERGIETEILPFAKAEGMGVCIYRPLAIGTLTGKYLGETRDEARGKDDQRVQGWQEKYEEGVQKLVEFAKDKGVNAADIANAWVVSHPAVTAAIVGVSRMEQLEANLKGFEIELTPEERETITGFFPTAQWEESGGTVHDWQRSYEIL